MKTILRMEYYLKGNNNNWYCDYDMYNSQTAETGTTKATGFGYDRQSTCISNAINKYKHLYKRFNKKAKKYTSYGLSNDNGIDYGIGLNAVIGCLKCFKNVKILENVELSKSGLLKIEITTNESEAN